MFRNVGKTLSIYQLAELGGTAFTRACTQQNIQAGFKSSGIWPLDKDIFTDIDFMPTDITYRPLVSEPKTSLTPLIQPSLANVMATNCGETSDSSLPSVNYSNINSPEQVTVFSSPEMFKGCTRAAPRKQSNRGRKCGKTMLATSSPAMNDIKEKKVKKSNPGPSKVKKSLFQPETENVSVSSDSDDIPYDDSTDSDVFDNESDMDVENEVVEMETAESVVRMDIVESVNVDDFVLCEFELKAGKRKYLIGKVLQQQDEDGDVEVSFLRKNAKIVDTFFMA